MPAILKPNAPAIYNPAHPLGTNPGVIVGLLAGSGLPTDDVDGAAGAYAATGGGTTDPAWGIDADGHVYLDFDDNGTGLGTEKELHFAGKAITAAEATGGVTLFAVVRPGATTSAEAQSLLISAKANDVGMCFSSQTHLGFYLGGSPVVPAGGPQLNTTDIWAVAVVCTGSCFVTWHARNLTTGVTLTPVSQQVGSESLYDRLYYNSTTAAVINHRIGGPWCIKGRLYMAGYAAESWDAGKIAAFYDNPWSAVGGTFLAPLVAGILSLSTVGSSSLGFSLAAPAGGVEPYGPVKVYKSSAAGFTPGPGNLAETIIGPRFPQPIALTGITPNSVQYVVATVGDSKTPSTTVVASNQAAGVVPSTPPGFASARAPLAIAPRSPR